MPDEKLAKSSDFSFDLDDSDWNMIMMMMMMFVMVSIMTSGLTQVSGTVAQQVAAQSYSGINDPRVVNATPMLSYIDLINEKPYQPWMIAFIVNRGPYGVDIAINYPAESFHIEAGGTRTINRSGAQERISVMFFQCEPGQRAEVEVTGEY